MKKLILIFQILIFTATHAVRADDIPHAINAADVAVEKVIPPMPSNYRLPEMQLVDSVKFYNQYKNQIGQRVEVEGLVGRFGATFGDDFRRKVYEAESQFNEKVEIILTLSSTMEDAKVLKKRMEMVGRSATIVEIPDHIQNRVLAEAEARAAGGLKELWWDMKDKGGKLIHPIDTISNTGKIIRNQFVKPNADDVYLSRLTLKVVAGSAIITTGASLMMGIGVDPVLLIAITAARLFFNGTTRTYNKTITNISRANIFNDLDVVSTTRQVIGRLSTFGLGIGEAYYGIGSSIAGSSYGFTQQQLLSNTLTSGVIETASAVERNKRLSTKASNNVYIMSLVIGSLIGSVGTMGHVGPLILDYGFFQISSLQAASLTVFTGLLVSIKYFTNHVEKVARNDMQKLFDRLVNFRKIKQEREAKEKLARTNNRLALLESISHIKAQRELARLNSCSKLFQ